MNTKKPCENHIAIMKIEKSLEINNKEKTETCAYCGERHKTFQKHNAGILKMIDEITEAQRQEIMVELK